MSLYDYQTGREISVNDPPFYAIIQAAMRKADTPNAEKLQKMWPKVWKELQDRYNAPGGVLPSDS